jgi:hypothetical protein
MIRSRAAVGVRVPSLPVVFAPYGCDRQADATTASATAAEMALMRAR